MGAHARWPRAQRAALPGSRRVVFLKAAPSSQPSPEVKRPMRSRDAVSGAPVARAGRDRAALCPGRRCVSASSPGRASRRGRRWRASSSASRPQFPAGTRPRRPAHVVPPTSSHPRAPGSPPSAPQRAAGLMIPRAGPFCPVGRGRGRRQAPCARSWRDVAVATGGSVPHRLLARAGSAAGARPLRFLGQLFSPALRPRFSS